MTNSFPEKDKIVVAIRERTMVDVAVVVYRELQKHDKGTDAYTALETVLNQIGEM